MDYLIAWTAAYALLMRGITSVLVQIGARYDSKFYTLWPNWRAAKIGIHLNIAQPERNKYHFNYTNCDLFSESYKSRQNIGPLQPSHLRYKSVKSWSWIRLFSTLSQRLLSVLPMAPVSGPGSQVIPKMKKWKFSDHKIHRLCIFRCELRAAVN